MLEWENPEVTNNFNQTFTQNSFIIYIEKHVSKKVFVYIGGLY